MKKVLKLPEDQDYTKIKLTTTTYDIEYDCTYKGEEIQEIVFSIEEKIIAKIAFSHFQECCEEVYADVGCLNEDYMETTELTDKNYMKKNEITVEFVDGYGVRVGGKPIPCYNEQNGYYSSDLVLTTSGFVENLNIEDVPKKDEIC